MLKKGGGNVVALGIVKEWAVFDVLWRLYYDVFPFPL